MAASRARSCSRSKCRARVPTDWAVSAAIERPSKRRCSATGLSRWPRQSGQGIHVDGDYNPVVGPQERAQTLQFRALSLHVRQHLTLLLPGEILLFLVWHRERPRSRCAGRAPELLRDRLPLFRRQALQDLQARASAGSVTDLSAG